MPIETLAATSASDAGKSDEQSRANLESLLGNAGSTEGMTPTEAVETEEPVVADETVETEAETEEVAEEVEEVADEAAETAEEVEEDEELALDEGDRDYSDSAYKKAAEFYSKKLKVQFDPNDAKDRATLSRLLQDRDALAAQRAEIEAAKADETDEEKPAEVKDAVPDAAQRAERVKGAITHFQTYAKTRVVPEVAKHIAGRFTTAMSDMVDEDGKWNITQENSSAFAEAQMEMGMHLLSDQLPNIIDSVLTALGKDPIMTRLTSSAVREGAFEYLEGLKDSAGTARYPDLERMVDRGEIQKVMNANTWIGKSTFDEKDPIKREAKRIEAAYKIARGETVIPQVTKAVQTGKKQAEAAARARGAARVAPGKTKGPIERTADSGQDLVRSIVSGGGSRFSQMVERETKKNRQ